MTNLKTMGAFFAVILGSCTANIVGLDDENSDLVGDDFSKISPSIGRQSEGLFNFLRDLPDEQIIAGQESTFWDSPWENWFPTSRDLYVQNKIEGKLPGLYSTDFGDFALKDLDNNPARVLEMRAKLVEVVLDYANQGSIISLSYHMCPPDEANGCGYDSMGSYSDQNPYPEWKIDELLTEGTELNKKHNIRLDEIAGYLKTLKEEGVNVVWRPYHEMNGAWFWWGKQKRYVDLYRHMFDRFTEVHQLDNLIWAWSVNYWNTEQEESPNVYYPGHDVVDIIGADIYLSHGHSYDISMYNELLDIGQSFKPMAITENGAIPDWPAIASEQPRWAFWTTWFGYESRTSDADYKRIFDDSRVTTLDELPPDL